MTNLSKRRFFNRKTTTEHTVRLPWLAEPDQFTNNCTRCNSCIAVCENHIIKKCDGGFPLVNFIDNECTFCYDCAAVCPEPLFLDRSDPPWAAKAMIDHRCLAKLNVECRSCMDVCDPMAISFLLQQGSVAQPQIDLDQCTGCGACVSVCPSASITVKLNYAGLCSNKETTLNSE